MDINSFIAEIKARADLREIVHHEELPSREPAYAETALPLMAGVKEALASLGVKGLFTHQARGIDLVRQGKNVVVMTPTASGKSLIYNLPVAEAILKDPEARAMYIFPLKGLEQDQLGAFRELAARLSLETEGGAPEKGKRKAFKPGISEIYDGDTSAYRRKRMREEPPRVVLTNPDMIHLAINPFHGKWERFLSNLRFVIVDEIHAYRGVFGSHVANVLRRFRRVAKLYGSDPVFIASSATIANPEELAEGLVGKDFEAITESGAPSGRRHFLFLNPASGVSPYTIATRLLASSVRAGFKTIAFTKARKVTELMHSRILDGCPDISPVVSSYRAGFLPEERRDIEKRLFKGELSGVISTSALELGVDIGGLDVCILVGYPGTVSSTWQRSGRVGRSGRDSLIVMVALADALDQHFMRNPPDFFRRSSESAVLDPFNRPIVKSHLLSAASERYLRGDDPVYDMARLEPVLEELEAEGKLRRGRLDVWFARKRRPQMESSIREAGEAYAIIKDGGGLLGESSSTRVLYDLHPGAIYLHKGVQYRVASLDMRDRVAVCRPAGEIAYYTRPMTEEESEILSEDDSKPLRNTLVKFGTLRITERVLGYRKKHIFTEAPMGEFLLDLPPSVFTTKGIWMKVGNSILEEVRGSGFSIGGALHAAEHSMIAALPLYALCDRMDLGGVSYTLNPELQSPAIFVYDGHEGGVGLARRGYDCLREWLGSALELMEDCPCEVACPSCTQDPRCGNNNEPLDKRGASMILRDWLGR